MDINDPRIQAALASMRSSSTSTPVTSFRSETPEQSTTQGRRERTHLLLDDEDGLTDKFVDVLSHIFSKYCQPSPTPSTTSYLLVPPPISSIVDADLDRFAIDTNGSPFDEATKSEIRDFFDLDERGGLTLKGFIQMYQLQTENDEEETWRDLSSHGFDRDLELVSTRREDQDETMAPPA